MCVSVAGFALERLVAERMGHLRIEQPSVNIVIGTNDAKATPESDLELPMNSYC
jgi:hypothetical protein